MGQPPNVTGSYDLGTVRQGTGLDAINRAWIDRRGSIKDFRFTPVGLDEQAPMQSIYVHDPCRCQLCTAIKSEGCAWVR